MERQDLKETVLMNLKSVTQSCKGGVPLTRLNKDYRDLLGSPIPFKELGYSSLESFIRDVPHAISLKESQGQLFAEGVADDSTAHIVSLVSRQKQTRTTRPGRKPFKRGGFSSRYRGGGRGAFNTSPKYSFQPTGYVKNTTVNHSKPPNKPSYTASNSTSVSFSKKYDVPPRFQRLQQQQKNREVENQGPSSSRNNLPSKSPSPEIFYSSRDSPVPRVSPVPRDSPVPSYSPAPLTPKRNSYRPPTPSKVAPGSQALDNDYFYQQRNPRPLRPKNDDRAEKLRRLENIENATDYINMYAEINNLTVEYSNLYMGQKKKTKGYTSVLKLGGKSYQSYPDLARTEEEAQDIAATKAMECIRESKDYLTAFPETPIATEEDIQALIKNIEEIVCEKPTGMFSHGIISEYESKFQESLPKGWIEKVKESPNFNVEQVAVPYGRVPDGVSWIIRPTRNYSSGSTTPSEVSVSQGLNGDAFDMQKLEHPPAPKVPVLKVPDGNEWNVYITYASSYIAARIIDFDDAFIIFAKSMYDFYKSHSLPVSEVHEGKLYALLKSPADGIVLRALVTNVINEDMVECYLVDEGYYDAVPKSSLNDLHDDFFNFPYQAIHLALHGLESYEPFMKPADLEIIQEKTLICMVKSFRHTEANMFPNVHGIEKDVYSVELYDTNDVIDDVYLNDYFKQTVLMSLEGKPPKEGTLNKGYLTCVSDNGQIYIRFLHPTKSLLEIELDKLSVEFEETIAQPSPFSSDEVYVAKFVDGKWRRAVMPEQPIICSDPNKVMVFFIDYGRLIAVNKSDIRPLFQYSECLASLSMQAIKCELHNALPPNHRWTEAGKMMLLELAPMEAELIVRVVVEGSDINLPKVNLHKRIGSDQDSAIISINDKLSTQLHLFQCQSNTSPVSSALNVPTNLELLHNNTELLSNNTSYNNLGATSDEVDYNRIPESIEWLTTPDVIKSPDAFDVVPLSPLKPPEVPSEGEMFDVFVTLAASPSNFIVQPLNCAGAMNELRIEMQKFYSTKENFLEMDSSMLREKCFYAALHPDGEWYRVRVVTVLESTDSVMAAVYYVDFGDFGNVSIQNLQLLIERFRNLPCQAIHASLSGIKPVMGSDWNVVHSVKFKDMVSEKNFVSIVKSKNLKEEEDFLSLELEVVLIDTSDPEKDLYINDLLIELAMARPV